MSSTLDARCLTITKVYVGERGTITGGLTLSLDPGYRVGEGTIHGKRVPARIVCLKPNGNCSFFQIRNSVTLGFISSLYFIAPDAGHLFHDEVQNP